jgi:hypothetical protein
VVETPGNLPDFVNWPSFPFTGDMRLKPLLPRAAKEPPRQGEDPSKCHACAAPDEAYIWVSERWRVRAMERPTGLPMVLILESRSHLDLGDLPNLLAAELGVMTVRLERAIRSLDGVARVHVNRWGDGAAHMHLWFLARPFGYLQLRGSFLSLWDDILPPIPEETWRENLALIAAWLAEFGGRPLAEPPRIDWQAPASVAAVQAAQSAAGTQSAQDKSVERAEAAPAAPAPETAPDAAHSEGSATPAEAAASGPPAKAPTAGTPAQSADGGTPVQGAAGAAAGQDTSPRAPASGAAAGAPTQSAGAAASSEGTAGVKPAPDSSQRSEGS